MSEGGYPFVVLDSLVYLESQDLICFTFSMPYECERDTNLMFLDCTHSEPASL
jgi:hypothetical protein